jgi:hypothetical protein
MAFRYDSAQTLFDKAIAYIESRINQTTPDSDKAYNKVLAGLLSMMLSQLLKVATDRAKEALTISASESGLTVIGQNRNLPRKPAESTVLTFNVNGSNGAVLETSVIWIATTGVQYIPDAQVIIGASGIGTVTATAQTVGVVGNLPNGAVLTADRNIANAEQTGTVTATTTTGADEENIEAWRQRLLDDERTTAAGSNPAAYRRNAELTPGVLRAYPYTGNPTYLQTGAGSIDPIARTIWIEADESIDPDGIPPSSLLDTAEEYIKTNQDTGGANEVLTGDGDSNRYVEPISRTVFFVIITGLTVPTDVESQTKTEIETALKVYFRSVRDFIEGLDFIGDKNDEITTPSISRVIQDIVFAAGGVFEVVKFNDGGASLGSYIPVPGELCKLADTGGVTYV